MASGCNRKIYISKYFFTKLLALSLILCQFHETSCALQYEYEITIDPESGHDSKGCFEGHGSCKTITYSFSKRRSQTIYIFTKGVHNLRSFDATFEQLSMLAFVGNHSTIQCMGNNSGFGFFNVKDITFSGLTFTNCSANRKSTSRNYNTTGTTSNFQVGLYFYECVNVKMQYVNVVNSPSATGVVMYDTSGNNLISDSAFQNNQLNPSVYQLMRLQGGGGGFYVEFTYCNLTQRGCMDSDQERSVYYAVYTFKRCQFTGNVANDSGNSTYIVPFHNDHIAFGRGGGLSVFFKGNSSYNNFHVVDCIFSNNTALWGAGLFVEFHDSAFNNTVNVSSSNFTDNICPYTANSGTAGGGMRIGHYVYGDTETHAEYGNWINIEKCVFTNNKALNGGGLSVSATPQDYTASVNQLSRINITDSKFIQNTARLGSAIHVDRFQLILVGQLLNLTIKRCSFSKNSINFLPDNYPGAYQVGVGTIFVHNVPIHFLESANFTDNTGSGLALVVGEASFCSCTAIFVGNTGNNGGGVALLGEAYIKIDNYTSMTFINNSATMHGGGIYNKYISRENLDSYTQCFIRHTNPFQQADDWEATFSFSGNKDLGNHRSSAIYTTSILPCSWAGGSGVNKNKSAIFCWKNWSYKNEYNDSMACKDEINTDIGDISRTSEVMIAYPGHPFELELNITDDLGKEKNNQNDIETAFIAAVNRNNSYSRSSFFRAWEDGAILREMGNVTLVLDSVEDRVWQISITIELNSCPPGFIPNSNDKNNVSCTCNTTTNYGGVIYCDNNNFTASLRNGYWIGNVASANSDNSSNLILASLCPYGFCYVFDHESSSESFFILSKTFEEVNEQICGKMNRNGTLCGSCIQGYGPAINSKTFDCVNCSNAATTIDNILKYVAAVYIPNVVLFVVIIAFKIQLTSGAANSFILYSQLVSSTFNLDADGQISLNLFQKKNTAILKAYQLIYGVFNLEYFENLLQPLCVGEGISTLTVISTDYAVAAAPLLMILIIVLFTKVTDFLGNCCARTHQGHRRVVNCALLKTTDVTRYMNKGLLSAFAAFLLLSYTKFSLTASYILQKEALIDEKGRVSDQPERVYYAGNFAANDFQYITCYLMPSYIILAVFVIIPPILLLDYPLRVFETCLMKVNCLWCYYPAGKVHVFLDTFQGCFRHNFRFFAGLYFLFRLTISVNFILSRTLLQQYIVQQIACIVMVILVAICQPYNKKNNFFNYVDLLIFSNLAILNALTLHIYVYIKTNPTMKPPVSSFAVQYILVYLPLIYICIYVLWYLCKQNPCTQCWKYVLADKCNWWKQYTSLNERTVDRDYAVTHSEVSGGIEESLTSERVILQRAEMANTYRPAKLGVMLTINEDCEPLPNHESNSTQRTSGSSISSNYHPLTNPTNCNYGSTEKVDSHRSRQSLVCKYSGRSTSSNGSSLSSLGVEAERGMTWPMQ